MNIAIIYVKGFCSYIEYSNRMNEWDRLQLFQLLELSFLSSDWMEVPARTLQHSSQNECKLICIMIVVIYVETSPLFIRKVMDLVIVHQDPKLSTWLWDDFVQITWINIYFILSYHLKLYLSLDSLKSSSSSWFAGHYQINPRTSNKTISQTIIQ